MLEAAEGDLEIRAAVTIAGDEIAFDFAGTAPQHEGNLNCPLAVTRSACYFVVRCLTAPDLPAVGRRLRARHGHAPEARSSTRAPPAAVAAGNVETSCRIVDCSSRRFGQAVPVPAQGQGTMNNLTFGNERFTYYETIGGGQGACPDADGPSAVHVTMSNTLTTRPRRSSSRTRCESSAMRCGSARAATACHRGGDGVVRELRVLEPCRISIISERRRHAPQGVQGGEPGQPAATCVNDEELPSKATRTSRPATSSGSKRREAAASARPTRPPLPVGIRA